MLLTFDAEGSMVNYSQSASTTAALIAVSVGWLVFAQPALAQNYPSKPVRVVVSGAPGSLSDNVTRLIFTRAGDALGQQFIIDNRPAVGGGIAAELVAKAPADGYTLLSTTHSVLVVNPFVYSKLGYDPLRDFDAVSMFMKISEVLAVHPSLNVKSVQDLVALAKARPKQIAYGSGGNGHSTHLMMELFQRKAGIMLVHVPFKGVSPAVLATVGGEVFAINVGLGLARPHIANGRVVALAKTGYPAKDVLPNVPALTSIYSDAEYVPWNSVFAPKGTSENIIVRLNAEIGKALAAPEVRTRMSELDVAAAGGTPAELDKALRADLAINRELVKSIGLRLD